MLALAIAAAARPGAADAQSAASASPADARLTIGLFTPTAPFSGPSERNQFIQELAQELTRALGRPVAGRVFATRSVFEKAVADGAIQLAVIDAPYAAALRLPHDILAAATRAGEATAMWQVVAHEPVVSLRELRGKTLAVPETGARLRDFVHNVLCEGEIGAGFAKLDGTPDAVSALTLARLGRADAALVPVGLPLPEGLRAGLALGPVGWPMLVALPGASPELARAVRQAAPKLTLAGALDGFTAADAGEYRALAGRFAKAPRRGPMAAPRTTDLDARSLLGDRVFSVPERPITRWAVVPPPP
jgi:hypothetical protein